MDNESKKSYWLHIIGAGVGFLAGSWWKSNEISESKKSRSEKDEPELVNEIRQEIEELLNDLEVTETPANEDEFRDIVADYLDEYSEYEIEVTPNTLYGNPDILVGGLLALETKYNPNKSEIDRCIGQCAGYSREWPTGILLFDTPSSRVRLLSEILADKGLDYIPVINFTEDKQGDIENENE
jgi:hypothetical protein